MTRIGACFVAVWMTATLITAQTPAPRQGATAPAPRTGAAQAPARAVSAARPASYGIPAATAQFIETYCFECHSGAKPEGGMSLDKLVKDSATSIGPQSFNWDKVAAMLESGDMPAPEASKFPTDAERAAAIGWVRTTLARYEAEHANEPGRVTVRRLTSGEYAYAIKDLTGVDVPVGIDASSDSVGGEGFSNFGDVQFVQDSNIERYLEAAKVVADHAVIGSGPLEFYTDPGKTGLELSALARINELYDTRGFRVVSGEGGRPFGLDRYGKALYVAWYYKHRVALADPSATVRGLAAKEGITGRFAEHVWTVMNLPAPGYPTREFVDRFKALPAPTGDPKAAMAKGRADTTALQTYLTTWPSWFFARGDLAAGGAGDESPLAFNDETLTVQPARSFTYALGVRPARGRGAPSSGPSTVHLTFFNLNPSPGVKPVVVWRNARVITRAALGPGRGGPAGFRGAGAGGAVPPAAGAAAPAGAGGASQVGAGAAVPPPAPPPPAGAAAAAAQAQGAGPGRGGRGGAPILSNEPLSKVLAADAAAALGFGKSPDGSTLGPDDFATTAPVSFPITVPANVTMELQVDAELGADRNAVVRLMISDRAEGSSRDVATKVVLGDPKSAGYKTYRAGMAEYASLLPPNSHGEANPADKDPVPAPFDNTYNSPEHDAFVLKVKYQRTDDFFTANMVDGVDRARLNHAWNDLFGSWPYHDAYLGMLVEHFKVAMPNPKIADMTPAKIATLPASLRTHVVPLRAHYDAVMRAFRAAEPGHLNDALEFASRAWRRPLTPTEKTTLRAFYQKVRTTQGLDHDAALRALIARVLVSPAFLYRLETVAAGPEKPLNNWELASRLSFFLWSSIPDDELRRAAGAGELSGPAQLTRQVKRMTSDPKARRMATEFFGQWLGFYRFDEYRGVDTTRFPEFTEAVQKSMYDEAVSTFEYIVREGRPVKEILQADYAFLNAPLAKFYGVDQKVDVKSTGAVVKVGNAATFDRGGALRLGSVLTVTSAPLRTSPVKRGDWVLRRILGTPTPPPPADAGSLPSDPVAFGGMTLRQRLTQHKRNPTCANCHLRIDPLGFPLERYDNIGRTREAYGDGNPVDVTGEFADKTTISGADGLLTYLATKDALVLKTLSKKMLGYALGRTVLTSDQRLVDQMVAAGNTATIADLATKIVTSRQFRNREGATR